MILLISDDSVTCKRLQSALPGRPLEQVSNVADLGASSGDFRPGLVLVDISDATDSPAQLPERIRGLLGSGPSIPVVALVDESAADASDGSSRSYDGVNGTEGSDCSSWRSYDGVIEKPVDAAQVESVLETAELLVNYDTAIGTLFELCRRRARDDADVSRDEILAAREEADSCLTALRESQGDLSFERLVRES